eukprot:CAMPEP_0195151936 /NCGR_PEP_ID=MMETSP0448-20130528/181499_1 /TAXON_ID=66468 /ORGANISM="Heterocapsa triquestra, Strain CCMP 448" /LENGTH=179 /DNA_ID=CAMNT_0040190673 /DNA_START=356 /DNA_END=892 /DNA_ORIENTATION=+
MASSSNALPASIQSSGNVGPIMFSSFTRPGAKPPPAADHRQQTLTTIGLQQVIRDMYARYTPSQASSGWSHSSRACISHVSHAQEKSTHSTGSAKMQPMSSSPTTPQAAQARHAAATACVGCTKTNVGVPALGVSAPLRARRMLGASAHAAPSCSSPGDAARPKICAVASSGGSAVRPC